MKCVSQKRRILLKLAVAATAMSTATGAGWTQPAEKSTWPKEAFSASTIEEALLKLTGGNTITHSPDDIIIKAPTVAEDGIAHITIQSQLPDTKSISIFVPSNAAPLVAHFKLNQKVTNTITTRIKIENSGEIIAVVDANNGLYSSTKKIRPATVK